MFIYCFDEQEKEKLQEQLILHEETNIDNKKCWIFIVEEVNGIGKFNINDIDKSKCVISNKLRF